MSKIKNLRRAIGVLLVSSLLLGGLMALGIIEAEAQS